MGLIISWHACYLSFINFLLSYFFVLDATDSLSKEIFLLMVGVNFLVKLIFGIWFNIVALY